MLLQTKTQLDLRWVFGRVFKGGFTKKPIGFWGIYPGIRTLELDLWSCDLDFQSRRAVVMAYTRATNQAQRSVGCINRWTDNVIIWSWHDRSHYSLPCLQKINVVTRTFLSVLKSKGYYLCLVFRPHHMHSIGAAHCYSRCYVYLSVCVSVTLVYPAKNGWTDQDAV